MANKVKFGLCNVHYAKVTETLNDQGTWETTYGTIKTWAGAVSLDASAEGSQDPFYADDMSYAIVTANSGYSGTFESALIPEDVLTSILNQSKDATTGLVTESKDDVNSYFALMFEVSGDNTKRRYVFYRCRLTRPNIAAQTVEDAKTPKTDSCNIRMTARPDDGKIVAWAEEGSTAFTNFFTEVQVSTSNG